MPSRMGKICIYLLLALALAVLSAPAEAEAGRVIFHAPRKVQILTGQILSSRAKEKPCERCHMRDHRGHCRRIISFNAEGVKC